MTINGSGDYVGKGCVPFVGLQSAARPVRTDHTSRMHPIEQRLQHAAAGINTPFLRHWISWFRFGFRSGHLWRKARLLHAKKPPKLNSSLKFDSLWADLVMRKHFDPVERATSDLFLRGGVGTPRNSSAFTTALRFSTNC